MKTKTIFGGLWVGVWSEEKRIQSNVEEEDIRTADASLTKRISVVQVSTKRLANDAFLHDKVAPPASLICPSPFL